MYSQNQTNERAKWFVNDRFGMFIHWGLYSAAEGVWKGEKVRYDNDYAEWIQYRNQIEKKEYVKLSKRFDWNEIDPEEWVLLAKKAGMKYTGRDNGGRRMEVLELEGHPYYVASQFHPEFKSRPDKPSPLHLGLVKAALANKKG